MTSRNALHERMKKKNRVKFCGTRYRDILTIKKKKRPGTTPRVGSSRHRENEARGGVKKSHHLSAAKNTLSTSPGEKMSRVDLIDVDRKMPNCRSPEGEFRVADPQATTGDDLFTGGAGERGRMFSGTGRNGHSTKIKGFLLNKGWRLQRGWKMKTGLSLRPSSAGRCHSAGIGETGNEKGKALVQTLSGRETKEAGVMRKWEGLTIARGKEGVCETASAGSIRMQIKGRKKGINSRGKRGLNTEDHDRKNTLFLVK